MNPAFQNPNGAPAQPLEPLPSAAPTKKDLLNHFYGANSDTKYIYKKFTRYRKSDRSDFRKFIGKIRDKLELSIRSGTQHKWTMDNLHVLINDKINTPESLYKKVQNLCLLDPELQRSVSGSLRERKPEDPLNVFLIFLVQSLFISRNITEQNNEVRTLRLFSEVDHTDGAIPNLNQQYFSEGFTFFSTEKPTAGRQYFLIEIPIRGTPNSEIRVPARLEGSEDDYQLILAPYSCGLIVSRIFEENEATIIKLQYDNRNPTQRISDKGLLKEDFSELPTYPDFSVENTLNFEEPKIETMMNLKQIYDLNSQDMDASETFWFFGPANDQLLPNFRAGDTVNLEQPRTAKIVNSKLDHGKSKCWHAKGSLWSFDSGDNKIV